MCSKLIIGLLMLVALVAQSPSADGAKILGVFSFPGKSHYMMHRALITELLKHGHQVTLITALTLDAQKLGSNYTEILIEPVYDFWKDIHATVGATSIYDMGNNVEFFLEMLEILGVATTEHALKQPNVQAIINAKQTKGVYDLLLVEQFYQDSFLALAQIYDVPVVSSSTSSFQHFMSQMFGIISPWSYVPFSMLPLTEHMNFWERVQNSFYILRSDLDREYSYFPKMDALVQKYFGHLPINFPSVSAMEKNLSATLINNYTPLLAAAPTASNMIYVGGMHIYPPKPLPTDIQKFLDDAEHGVIYFSLGSQVQSKDMPLEKLQVFLDVFRQLKQRVLWKFENDTLPNLPKNVMVKKWMPQNDILAHPNVRVFIAHGGLFGTQEAIHHGVPILGMPFYFDQNLNLKKAELGGYATILNFNTLTREDLKNGLNKLLFNPSYRDTAKRVSNIFRDRPMGPRETAIYWIDYVIRHKGARHLRAAGLDMKWYQFYLVDVISLVLGTIAVATALAAVTILWIYRNVKSARSKHKVQ